MGRGLRLIDNESGIVEVTSRTLHGRFLMRPSEHVNSLILGVLGRAQAKYSVELFAFVFLSNHFHLLLRVDSAHQLAAFVGYLKANIAKELGRLHGWNEKFWGRRYHSASVADSESAQSARFIYILRNGCKEGLVGTPLDWPGVSSAAALYSGRSAIEGTWYDRTAEYQARTRRNKAPAPRIETVRLSPLPFLRGRARAEQRRFAVRCVKIVSEETRARHLSRGTSPRGARFIHRQHPHDRSVQIESSSAPLFHATTAEELSTMKLAREVKVAAYRQAADRQRRGQLVVRFPEGCFPPPRSYVGRRAPPMSLTT